jgi:phosphatidylinositol alpha 1,6-mannosyltransferase
MRAATRDKGRAPRVPPRFSDTSFSRAQKITAVRRNQNMRIAIAAESFRPRANGVSNSVVQVARHLRKRGVAGLIIAPDSYPHDEFEGTPVHRVRSVEIPGVHDVDIVLSSAQAMREVIEDFGATSVHLASPFVLGWQALSGAQLAGVPVVSAFQTHISGFAHHYGFSPVAFLADSVVRRIHRNSQLNLAPSRDSVDYLRRLGISRISTWGRGVDLGQFGPEQRSPSLRDSWNVGDRKVVGFVGRLAPEKNAHLLARFAGATDTAVVIVGDGPSRVALERLMPEATFTGRLTGGDLAAAVASMDVLVAPGELETFCQVVQEGMASGVPVVAPAIGGPRDLIEHESTGLLYRPGDSADMATQVGRLLTDELLHARISRAAHSWVQGRTWEALGDQLLEHHRLVTADKRSRLVA